MAASTKGKTKAKGKSKPRRRATAATAAAAAAAATVATRPARKAARKAVKKPSTARRVAVVAGKAGLTLATAVTLKATEQTVSKKAALVAAGTVAAGGMIAEVLSDHPLAEIAGTAGNAAIASTLADVVTNKLIDFFGIERVSAEDDEAREFERAQERALQGVPFGSFEAVPVAREGRVN